MPTLNITQQDDGIWIADLGPDIGIDELHFVGEKGVRDFADLMQSNDKDRLLATLPRIFHQTHITPNQIFVLYLEGCSSISFKGETFHSPSGTVAGGLDACGLFLYERIPIPGIS